MGGGKWVAWGGGKWGGVGRREVGWHGDEVIRGGMGRR